ncbi:MAG: hypothetical protein ACYTG7_20140 [Planctomycetota bacterium]|jgi:hypothetical protein
MNNEQWQRVKDLFHAALEHAPEARPAFLDEACKGDAALRIETPPAPYDLPMQALIGLDPDSLTNLWVLEVR